MFLVLIANFFIRKEFPRRDEMASPFSVFLPGPSVVRPVLLMRVGWLRRFIKLYVSTGNDLGELLEVLDPKIVLKFTQTSRAVLRLNPCVAARGGLSP